MGFHPTEPVTDGEYLLKRATLEAEMAKHADKEPAAVAHRQMAGWYLSKLFGEQGRCRPHQTGTPRPEAVDGPTVRQRWSALCDPTSLVDNHELTALLQRLA